VRLSVWGSPTSARWRLQSGHEWDRYERNARILELYLRCWTEQAIADDVSLGRKTVDDIIGGFFKNEMSANPPSSLEEFNIWDFGLAADCWG